MITKVDSVIVKDTIIKTPSRNASINTSMQDIARIIDSLSNAKSSSVVAYKKIDSTLSASVAINRNGAIQFNCKEDSLKMVIHNITTAYLQLLQMKEHTNTIQVPGPVQIEAHVPKWLLWWFIITALLMGLKITSMFFPSGKWLSVLGWFKNIKG